MMMEVRILVNMRHPLTKEGLDEALQTGCKRIENMMYLNRPERDSVPADYSATLYEVIDLGID